MAGAAIAAADELRQSLRDQFLQCKICLDGLKDPKTLSCLHTFCASCVRTHIVQNASVPDGRTFPCPICRRRICIPLDGVTGFPDSFFVHSLNDVLLDSSMQPPKSDCAICKFKDGRLEAKVFCVECRVELCDNCARDHQLTSVTEGHTLLPLFGSMASGSSSINRENYCRIHKGETVKYYCETCNSPICLPCTFLDHRGHTINEIRSVRQQFTSDMEQLVIRSEDSIIQLQSARDDLAELENELFVRKEAVKQQIRRTVTEVVQAIKEREDELIGDVETFYDTLPVSADRQRMEKTIYRLQRAHDFARQLLAGDTSPITQLINRSEAKDNLHQAQHYELPDLASHLQKLDRFLCFLPGGGDLVASSVGSLLKCGVGGGGAADEGGSRSVLVPCSAGAVNRAVYVRRLSTAQAESLSEVVALAFLPSNDCAVLGTARKFVRIFDTGSGSMRSEFGGDEVGESLVQPSDMTVTRDGDLAITDCGLLCVKVFDVHGAVQLVFGNADVFALPIAIAIDCIGRFLVSDQVRQRVTVHRQHGELLLTLDVCDLASPHHLCTFANRLYVADSVNNVVAVYSYSKEGVQLVGKLTASGSTPDFLDCSSICLDRTGNLLIADAIFNRIHVFTTSGELGGVTAAFGRPFYRPSCLAASCDGLVAVAQKRGSQLDVLDSDDGESTSPSATGLELNVLGSEDGSSSSFQTGSRRHLDLADTEDTIAASQHATEVLQFNVLGSESGSSMSEVGCGRQLDVVDSEEDGSMTNTGSLPIDCEFTKTDISLYRLIRADL